VRATQDARGYAIVVQHAESHNTFLPQLACFKWFAKTKWPRLIVEHEQGSSSVLQFEAATHLLLISSAPPVAGFFS
jgi:hypothetical protein